MAIGRERGEVIGSLEPFRGAGELEVLVDIASSLLLAVDFSSDAGGGDGVV